MHSRACLCLCAADFGAPLCRAGVHTEPFAVHTEPFAVHGSGPECSGLQVPPRLSFMVLGPNTVVCKCRTCLCNFGSGDVQFCSHMQSDKQNSTSLEVAARYAKTPTYVMRKPHDGAAARQRLPPVSVSNSTALQDFKVSTQHIAQAT